MGKKRLIGYLITTVAVASTYKVDAGFTYVSVDLRIFR